MGMIEAGPRCTPSCVPGTLVTARRVHGVNAMYSYLIFPDNKSFELRGSKSKRDAVVENPV